jgi:hypothetical protein
MKWYLSALLFCLGFGTLTSCGRSSGRSTKKKPSDCCIQNQSTSDEKPSTEPKPSDSDGVVRYELNSRSFSIDPKATEYISLVDNDLIFQSFKLTPYCPFSTDKILMGHSAGFYFIAPEIESIWHGVLDEKVPNPLFTVVMKVEINETNVKYHPITTDFYKKDWIAKHEDGKSFYTGVLDTLNMNWSSMKANYGNLPVFSGEVNENDSVKISMCFMAEALKLKVRSLKMLVLP